MVEKSIRI